MRNSEILFSILQLAITLLGFVITFVLSRREFRNSISKLQKDKQIDKIDGMQKELLDIIEYLLEQPLNPDPVYDEETMRDKIINILKKVKSYASNDAVRIARHIMSEWYEMDSKNNSTEFISSCFVLISQLKYDTTGIRTSPRSFLPERYEKSFEGNIILFSQTVNYLIDYLELKNIPKITTINPL